MKRLLRALKRVLADTEMDAITFDEYKSLHPKTRKSASDPMFEKTKDQNKKSEDKAPTKEKKSEVNIPTDAKVPKNVPNNVNVKDSTEMINDLYYEKGDKAKVTNNKDGSLTVKHENGKTANVVIKDGKVHVSGPDKDWVDTLVNDFETQYRDSSQSRMPIYDR